MKIPLKIQDRKSASDEWLKQRLVIDDLELPDYERPLKEMKVIRRKLTPTEVVAFGWDTIKIKCHNLLP